MKLCIERTWRFKLDTASISTDHTMSARSVLVGEGSSKDSKELMDTVRLITKQDSIDNFELERNRMSENIRKIIKIKKKNNYRVPVQYPDGQPGMPTSNKKANLLLEQDRAEIIKNKLNVFAIRLKFWPVYRNLQPMALLVDPGSTFTGIAVMSKKCINLSYMIELPGYKKGSKPIIVEKKLKIIGKNNGKIVKIEKWPNTIVDRMTERRMLRRGRRHRKCRRRECRFLNRSKKGKLAPSMLAKKQLELEVVKELVKLYSIKTIGFEDVSYNHYRDIDGIKGTSFSQVEIGKNWLLDRLKKIIGPDNIRMIKGFETSSRRELLKLPKEKDKTKRNKLSHVTDCVAMGSIILGILDKSNIPGNKFHFNVLSRPKYNRRSLFAYEPGKGGIFERYGGHIPNDKNGIETFKGLRKGDYVECKAPLLKKIFRGWISGYTGDRIYISDFDWNQSPSFSVDNVKLLDRNHGLINLRLSWIKCLEDICELGTRQINSEGMKVNRKMVDKTIKDKKKAEKDSIKESNKLYGSMTPEC